MKPLPDHDAPTARTKKVLVSLTEEQVARINARRGVIPLATWCADAIVRAAETPPVSP